MAGHSNGCMMSFAMGMKQSDMVAAVCCHSGVLMSNPSDDYDPRPTWFVHGEKDDVLPYDGLENYDGTGTYMPGAQEAFDYLSDLNGCSINSTTDFDGGYTQDAWNCTNGANVTLMTLTDAEHSPYIFYRETEIDTTLAAWEFCSGFELSEEPELDDF